MPTAATENVAGCPAAVTAGCGGVAMIGDTAGVVTVSRATDEETAPAALLTITEKRDPLSEATVAAVV